MATHHHQQHSYYAGQHNHTLDADMLALWSQDSSNAASSQTPSQQSASLDNCADPLFGALDTYSVTTDCGGLRCFSLTCVSCAALTNNSTLHPAMSNNSSVVANHEQAVQDGPGFEGSVSSTASSPQLFGQRGFLHTSQSYFDLSSPLRTSAGAPTPLPALSGMRRVSSTPSLFNNSTSNNVNNNTPVPPPPASVAFQHHSHHMASLGSEGNLSQLSASPVSTSHSLSGGNGGSTLRKTGSSRDLDNTRIQKRLARKAELARESRKRKKAYLTELEEKIDKLQYKIAEMEEQVAIKALKNEGEAMGFVPQPEPFNCGISDVESLNDMEIQTVISNFEKVTLGRRLELEECLSKVRNAITPSKQVKFLLWAFDQKDAFYEGAGLWNSLLYRELECPEETVLHLKAMRDAIRKDRRGLQDLDQELGRLSTEINQYYNQLGMLIMELGKIMTHRQLAKFIAWIENSEWCMQMLDSLWSSVFEQEL
jgi:hypothetical protein